MADLTPEQMDYASSNITRLELVPILQDMVSSNIAILDIIVTQATTGKLEKDVVKETLQAQRDLAKRLMGLVKLGEPTDG